MALGLLIAVAARAAAEPVPIASDDELGDGVDDDAEVGEIVERPDVADAATSADAETAIDDLGAEGIGGIAGSEDWLEGQARHQRPSPWGRVDLQLSYLHRDDAPATVAAHGFDELWLVLVWRR